MVNYKFSDSYCDEIISFFENSNLLYDQKTQNRKYKKFKINVDDLNFKWLVDSVNKLIKENLGIEYYMSIWLLVLKYDVGDYFLKHIDRDTKDNRCYSGGVELSPKTDFEGGKFIVSSQPRDFERGTLLTHSPEEYHEITQITQGTRWSLHFGISDRANTLI